MEKNLKDCDDEMKQLQRRRSVGAESGRRSQSGLGTSQLSVLIDREGWREGKKARDVQAKQPVTSYN